MVIFRHMTHLLMLGANHSLWVIGVSFQLYGQLKKSPHDGTGVLGSTAVLTASQATRLGKGSSVMVKGCKRELHTGTNKTMLCQLPIVC